MTEPLRETIPEPSRAPAPRAGPAQVIPITAARAPAVKATDPRTTLTVVSPIKPDHVDALRLLLESIDRKECREGKCPLPGLEGSIQTMHWLILPDAVRESGVVVRRQSLVLWTVFDGSMDDHVRALTGAARARLDEVYVHCEDYPAGGSATEAATYLARHTASSRWVAAFDGTPGRTMKQINDEDELHERLKDFLRGKDWTDRSRSHVYLEAKAWLKEKEQANLQWALNPVVTPKPHGVMPRVVAIGAVVGIALWALLGLVGALLLLAGVLGLLLIVLAAWLYTLRRAEIHDERSFVRPARQWLTKHDADIAARENETSGLNRMTILTDLHPGFIRALTMRVVLWAVNFRANSAMDGKLQGVETIHFAQWRLVDGGRRLLFMSNYDGRADDYFRDFSDNAAPGVNAIWSNTVGFPPTVLLIGNGSRDLPRFQQSARAYQIPTDVWYFGYRGRLFTTKRINDNSRIREGIAGQLTPAAVNDWLEMVYSDGT